jgi:CheY-like chemotaxis protein
VARILICEPHGDLRALLTCVIERLEHEALQACLRPGEPLPRDVHAVVVEPADPRSRDTARRLRQESADLPIVCVSIYPPGPDTHTLQPVAHLVKPFGLAELERALTDALAAVTLAA